MRRIFNSLLSIGLGLILSTDLCATSAYTADNQPQSNTSAQAAPCKGCTSCFYPCCVPQDNGCWNPYYAEDAGCYPNSYPCCCSTSGCGGPSLDRFCATAVAGCGDDFRWPNALCGNDPFRDDSLYCGADCCDEGDDCCGTYEDPCYGESCLGPAYLCPDPDLCWDSYEYCGFNCANGYNVAGTLNPDYRRHGIFMPAAPTLFPHFIADPRAINLSVGWRFNDQVFEKNMIDVSYAQWCPFWRWFDVFCCGDALQFELEGCLWAIFDPLHDSSPLVNADYYVGFPLTWKHGRWSWRLRGYHISSHIGDEFLLDHPRFVRRNPSAQYVDFFVAYQLFQETRIYFGYGHIFGADESFPVRPNYFGWGVECYLPYLRWNGWRHCVEGRPFFALHMRNLQDDGYREDSTYALGYEFHKLTGLEGKLRAFMEYHKGASLEGQFSRLRTDYFSIRLSYGY